MAGTRAPLRGRFRIPHKFATGRPVSLAVALAAFGHTAWRMKHFAADTRMGA
jgi:hypothetical protein